MNTKPKINKTMPVAEGLPGRVMRLEMPRRSSKEAMAQAARIRKMKEKKVEELRKDKSWDRTAPKTGYQYHVALEELHNDKSWDRSSPAGSQQELVAKEEEHERMGGRSIFRPSKTRG